MARRKIAGLRVLITGATQGIGRSLAFEAGRRGAKLIVSARTAIDVEQLVQELEKSGFEAIGVTGDVADPADRQKMLDSAVDHFGGLDVLINNAGIGATGHFVDANEDRLRKIMEVNFFGLTELTRLAIPILRNGVKPMIVNISSVAGKRGIPARSEYSASKFAVQGFTEALRAEMARFDIDVLSVCPGLTATNFSKNMIENKARIPMDHMRSMTADQVAGATLNAMKKGKHEVVLTLKGRLLVCFNRLFPLLTNHIVAKKVRSLYREEIEARQKGKQESNEPVGARG